MSAPTGPRLAEALAYAERLHRGQTRKKTLAPTLSHVMAVASVVLEHGGDEEEAIAALLHDAPEDCGGRPILEAIRRRFGERVADIVEGCTDSLELPEPSWQERKQRYIDRLATASDSTLLVSLADKVHNVRSLVLEYRQVGDALWDRFTATRDQTFWYYRSLLAVFRAGEDSRRARLVGELAAALATLEELAGPS